MREAACAMLVVTLWALFVYSGARGLDFGTHWDEDALVNKVKWSVEVGGVLLPPTYDWPGGTYWVAVAAFAPDVVAYGRVAASISDLEHALLTALDQPEYRQRLRLLFLLLASAAIPLVALGVWKLGAGPWAAVLAAGILAGAWEIAYHARWAAPDSLLLTLSAGVLLATICGRDPAASRARRIGAVVAGFALGTKYSIWPLLLPLLGLELLHGRAREAGRVLALACLGFLVATPGMVFMPVRVLQGAHSVLTHYQQGHGVHTVTPGVTHLLQAMEYLGLVVFSPWTPVAMIITALALLGLWRASKDRPLLVATSLFPVAFVAYFAINSVLIVRNLLPVVPFAVVLVAIGSTWVSARLPGTAAHVFAISLAILVTLNLGFVFMAGDRIASTRPDLAGETSAWLAQNKSMSVAISPALQSMGVESRATDVPSATLLMLANEPVCGRYLPANVRGLTALVAGWREVNLDYYPDWAGHPHVVAVDLQRLVRATGCQP